ncbi:MAG: 5'-methylthioadenosine/adenosylhomocysteine nucleosidase [Cellulosilyticaceae bacterium]
MNTVGIIGAMEEEVISIKRQMKVENTLIIAGMEFCEGILKEKKVVVVRCGIGKVNSAVCTQILIDKFDVNCIINTGVAGGLYPDINIGDIVISSDTVQHDIDKSFFEADAKLIELGKAAAESLIGNQKVYIGRIASGDQFISSMRVKEDIYTTFTAYCAEMEGAAIAHTCYLNQIPFVVIRSISDKADQSAEVNFDEFVHLAAKNASKMIEAIIEKI